MRRENNMEDNKNKTDVDIIICARNNKELTDRCLDSLLNLTYPVNNIILIDDCSTDNSAEFIKSKYPSVTIIENEKNIGPSKSRNIGVNLSKAKYIVTMDNDAYLSPDWLSKMVTFMESDSNIGQASGKVLFTDDHTKIAEAGMSMKFYGKVREIGFKQSADKYNEIRQVLLVSTASMIAHRDIINAVGGFYDNYFYGPEDADLSLRINMAGYKIMYYPNAISYHTSHATVSKSLSSRRDKYYWMRNRLILLLRNYEFKNLLRYVPLNLRFTLSICRSDHSHIIPALLGWLWIIYHLPNIIIERTGINRKVKDDKLHKLFNKI